MFVICKITWQLCNLLAGARCYWKNPHILPTGIYTSCVVRKRCIVTGKVPTIYLKVFVLSVLLGRTTMFVYKLPIRLLLKYWRISDVFHASLISLVETAAPSSLQQLSSPAAIQQSFRQPPICLSSSVVVTLSSFTCREQCNCSATLVCAKWPSGVLESHRKIGKLGWSSSYTIGEKGRRH